MYKAYKYRLYPNQKQEKLLLRNISYARFLYNQMLADSIEYYEQNHKAYHTSPTPYKKKYPFLREADSLALMNAHQHLRKAFENFFKQPKVGFPKFKSRKHCKWSYTTNLLNRNIQLTEKKIKLPKIGWINYRQHRAPTGTLKYVTITYSRSGRWYVSCTYELPNGTPVLKAPQNAIGLDYSSSELYVDSNGNKPHYPRFYRKAEEKLAREQRKLSHMQQGSNNWLKQKRKIARIYEHVANQRTDFLHKQSRQIANAYDLVGVESLNLKAISQTLHLGKSTMDNGYGKFVSFLEHKTAEQGKQVVKIDKWYPSTKTCSFCGNVKPMKLAERIYCCPKCGQILDRDINAAINIRREAIKKSGACIA